MAKKAKVVARVIDKIDVETPTAEQTSKPRPMVNKRAFWSGSISLGLINVPVKLLSMEDSKQIRFRWLSRDAHKPVHLTKTVDGNPIDHTDVVLGYEESKGNYVIVEQDELKAIKPESDRRIRIDGFVNLLEIDPMYFNKTYILSPGEGADEAYGLLRAVLQRLGKAGVGKVTIRDKEHPALIYNYHGGIVISTLFHIDEVVDPTQISGIAGVKEPNKDALELAMTIVDKLSMERLDLSKYEDTMRLKVLELIAAKKSGKEVPKAEKKDASTDLVAALKAQLGAMQ